MTDRRAAFNIAFFTMATIFIMGYINAFSLSLWRYEQYGDEWLLGAMITPQTGNLIWMGKWLADGQWAELFTTIMLFLGFIAGCIFGNETKDIIKHKTKQFIFSWTSFILPVIAFPIYMRYINTDIAYALLGLSAGIGLGSFRQLYHIDINNAMATGNVRFLGLWFWEAIIKRTRSDKKEVFTFLIFFVSVILFIFGASFYTLLSNLEPLVRNIWALTERNANFYVSELILIIICLIPYFFAPRSDLKKPIC